MGTNTIIPPTIWFRKFRYASPSTDFGQYESSYWALSNIFNYMNWFFFWVVHPAVFILPSMLFPFIFFKFEKLNWLYVEAHNFAWFAIPIVYPLVTVLFFFSTSPYFMKTDLERAKHAYGRRNEDVIFWLYLGVAFISAMVQGVYNKEINEWYYGLPENNCDYYIDGYCKKKEVDPTQVSEIEFAQNIFEF